MQELKSKMCDDFQRIIFRQFQNPVTTKISCNINSVALLHLEILLVTDIALFTAYHNSLNL